MERKNRKFKERLSNLKKRKEVNDDWIRKNQGLKNQIKKLEQNIESNLFKNRRLNDLNDVQKIEQELNSLDVKRIKTQNQLLSSVNSISRKVKLLKKRVKTALSTENPKIEKKKGKKKKGGKAEKEKRKIDEVTIKNIERLMEGIETEIVNHKEKNKLELESLTNEEKILSKELEFLQFSIETNERKFQMVNDHPLSANKFSFGPRGKKSSRRKSVTSVTSSKTQLPKEIKAYDMYLRSHGGKTGSWAEEEHKAFQRLYRKHQLSRSHKNIEAFTTEALRILSNYTLIEIRSHLNFYERLRRLNVEKKAAIMKWREERENEQMRLFLNSSTERNSEKTDEEIRKADRLQKARLSRKKKKEEEKRRRIEAWKRRKKAEELEKLEEEVKLEKEKKKKEIKKLEERKKKTKERVNQYKIYKERLKLMKERDLIFKVQNQKKTKKRELIKMRKRDEEIMKKRMAQKKKKMVEEKKREERIEKYLKKVRSGNGVPRNLRNDGGGNGVIIVERDFDRLTSLTRTQIERKKRIEKEKKKGGKKDGLFILHSQGRTVPGWRQGL